MTTIQRTTTYAVCPSCGADAGCVDHLLGTVASSSWYCDACGHRYHLEFSADGAVEISRSLGRKIETTDLLVLKPQKEPVYFIVPGMRFEENDGRTPEEERDGKQFYYETHSCPINWLKPTMVYIDGDSDPHGFLEFVDSVDTETLPPDQDYGPNDHDAALVALIEKWR